MNEITVLPIEILMVEDNPDDVRLTSLTPAMAKLSNSSQALADLGRQRPSEEGPSA